MRILLPFDGSPASLHAARYVARQPKRFTNVLLLNVQRVYLDAELMHARSAFVNFHRHEGEAALHEGAEILSQAGIEHEAQVAFGPVAEVIALAANKAGADAIVMGTRARHPLVEMVARSVPARVVRRTAIPVVLVPHKAPRAAPRTNPADAPFIGA